MSNIKDPNKVYGQTISFRYYVNKHLKPRTQHWDGKLLDAYPLYIQIKAKQQTSQRKSILSAYVAPERLDQYLLNKAVDVATETNALRGRILAHKPFDSASFSLSQSLDGYNVYQEDVCYLIGELLREDYRKARVADSVGLMKSDSLYNLPELQFGLYSDDEDEQLAQFEQQATDIFYRGKVDEIIHPMAVFGEVRDLAVLGKPHVKALYDKFEKDFWGIDRYCQVIREQEKFTIISLGIFASKNFHEIFRKYFFNDVYNKKGVTKDVYKIILFPLG